MNKDNIKLRNRFVDDFNLPVSVFDSPYFEYQLKLYNAYNRSNKRWEWLLSLINEHYDGNENRFLDDYYDCRDKIITSMEKSKPYKDFISSSMEKYVIPPNEKFNTIGKTSVYTKTNNNKFFLSIDLKHANFQGLKYYNPELVNHTNNYENFLKHNIGFDHPLLEYFNGSKYSRQIIFGKLNMPRNITIQKYLMYEVYLSVKNIIDNEKILIHSKQVDELILEIKSVENIGQFLKNLYHIQKSLEHIHIRFELYHLNMHSFETSCGNHLSVYEKNTSILEEINNELWVVNDDMNIGKIKCCPLTYFPQVYKFLTYKEICEEMDLVFYYEKNLCRFLKPIKKMYI